MRGQGNVSRLDMLYGLRQYLQRELLRVDRWIDQELRREREWRRGERSRPPAPEWIVELGIGQGRPPVLVHVGGCPMARGRQQPVPREQALRARADGVEACAVCGVDRALGYIEG